MFCMVCAHEWQTCFDIFQEIILSGRSFLTKNGYIMILFVFSLHAPVPAEES